MAPQLLAPEKVPSPGVTFRNQPLQSARQPMKRKTRAQRELEDLLADSDGKANSDLNDLWKKLRGTLAKNESIVKE